MHRLIVRALLILMALSGSMAVFAQDGDRDGDGVPDAEDACPDEFSFPNVGFAGCPDDDGDGLFNRDDECPLEPSDRENGCPDDDGDGVQNNLDNCPEFAGPAELDGCPDRDGDGITDSEDWCPDIPGIVEKNGCIWIDSDGDSIRDVNDYCPNNAGPEVYGGCPDRFDSELDGVRNNEDACPLIPGDFFSGCPADRDGDGVTHYEDACPYAPGPPDGPLAGCPPGAVDTDGDGFTDQEELCDNDPGPNFGCRLPEIEGTHHDNPPDRDNDGVIDAEDRCLNRPGDLPNGCPSDVDGDGIPNAGDACPGTPGAAESGGCESPAMLPAGLEGGVLRIQAAACQNVYTIEATVEVPDSAYWPRQTRNGLEYDYFSATLQMMDAAGVPVTAPRDVLIRIEGPPVMLTLTQPVSVTAGEVTPALHVPDYVTLTDVQFSVQQVCDDAPPGFGGPDESVSGWGAIFAND